MTALPPFEQVLDRYGADVWRFAAAQAGPAHADDVFQETMMAALAVDGARARAGQVAHQKEPAVPPAEPPDDGLWARVRALPPKQREAVALRTILDLPYAEIAATLATSVEAARRNVHEGLKTLRKEVTR